MSEQTRRVNVTLTTDQARFIDQERSRLEAKFGKRFSANEVLQLLVEQHMLKMQMVATADPDSVPWMYRRLAEAVG